MKSSILTATTLAALLVTASAAPAQTQTPPRPMDLSLGVVQRLLKAGMTTSEVFESVGSPNLVTRDREGRETWVYDRFSTEFFERGFSAGGGALGGGGSIIGALGLSGSSGKKTVSQNTLMVSVRFTADGKVDTFTYRSSRF